MIYFIRHLKLKISMMKTLTDSKVKDTALEERSIIEGVLMTLIEVLNAHTINVRNSMALKEVLICILKSSTMVVTRQIVRRSRSLLFLPKLMVFNSQKIWS